MDYLDPKKQQRHRILLFTGYILIGVAILISVLILKYLANGYGIGKNGAVIQNSLTFFSSQPNPANIYVNGKLAKVKTNTRLVLPEGIYHITLARQGYRDWQRSMELDGGHVQHFDYPFLFPKTLTTKKVQTYTAPPTLVTQSLDRRWVLVNQAGNMSTFELYDLKTPTKTLTTLTLPSGILSKATSNESWQVGEWADDNRHVLMQHLYDGKTEYILADRANPDQSVNLNTTLSVNPTKLTLQNRKFDRYLLYDASAKTLNATTLSSTAQTPVLQHVLAYQPYSTDTFLYVTDSGAPAGKVLVKLLNGNHTDTLRSLPVGTNYLVDLTKYSGTLYVAMGASSENKVYIYKNPLRQLNSVTKALVPAQVLHVTQPNYLSFSPNAQFIVAENATQFGVYDIENAQGYNYTATEPIDTPQAHAVWMDGNRLTYVSNGAVTVFDYDHTNSQKLVASSSNFLPLFAPNYKYVYTLSPSKTVGQIDFDQTALLNPADL
jgi:hypothetical protein